MLFKSNPLPWSVKRDDNFQNNRKRNHLFYISKQWLAIRNQHVNQQPLCQTCKRNGKIVEATQVHHLESLNTAWFKRLDPENLESICDACHMVETLKEQGKYFEVNKKEVKAMTQNELNKF
jgi:5-methylcytosine-specific restriction protein A